MNYVDRKLIKNLNMLYVDCKLFWNGTQIWGLLDLQETQETGLPSKHCQVGLHCYLIFLAGTMNSVRSNSYLVWNIKDLSQQDAKISAFKN